MLLLRILLYYLYIILDLDKLSLLLAFTLTGNLKRDCRIKTKRYSFITKILYPAWYFLNAAASFYNLCFFTN